MAYLPWIDGKTRQTVATEIFGGINRNMKAADGEFADTYNMGSGFYPLLAQRNSRGLVKRLADPAGMIGKEHLCYVDGEKLYYNKFDLQAYDDAANIARDFAGWSVHIPSLAVPRGTSSVVNPSLVNIYAESEGYVVDVYKRRWSVPRNTWNATRKA